MSKMMDRAIEAGKKLRKSSITVDETNKELLKLVEEAKNTIEQVAPWKAQWLEKANELLKENEESE